MIIDSANNELFNSLYETLKAFLKEEVITTNLNYQDPSEIWQERYQYKEAAPHLILQAFMQRIINRGGRISREPAAGRGRLDLCLHYRGLDYPVELKLRYGEATYREGKDQLARYMKRLGCDEGWLIVFDRRKRPSWDEKLFWKTATVENRTLHTVGC